jgi:predicted alpha/beta hydrolase
MRFYVIDDDRFFAPASAVRALAEFYPQADRQILHLIPADYGQHDIGHFGFFREGMSQQAWKETADWLLAAAFPSALHQVA